MNMLAKTAIAALALTGAAAASANVMTFGTFSGGLTTYTEDGITGTNAGSNWYTYPTAGVAHFDAGSVNFAMAGLFDAVSVDLVEGGGTGTSLWQGFLNGALVGSTTFSGGGGTGTFGAGFSGIDTLRVSLTGSHFSIDNLTLTAADVPEPAMLGLFGLGAIGLGLSRRRRRA